MIILYGKGQYGTPHRGTALNIPLDDGDDTGPSLDDWVHVAKVLYRHSLEPNHPDHKDAHYWFNPVVLKPGALTRKLTDIDWLEPFLCLDIDAKGWTVARLRDRLAPLRMIIYTTASSTTELPRWRLVVFLDRPYSVAEHRSIWTWFNQQLDGEIDQATKDASRINYMPAQWCGADNQFLVYDGIPMGVDIILQAVPIIEPTPVTVIEDMAFTNAPDGTPIITQKIIDTHTASLTGRMFKILCAAATNYKINGWTLTTDDLFAAALPVARLIGHVDTDTNLKYECKRAIEYINGHVVTKTKIERARERLQFEQEQKRSRRNQYLRQVKQ